MKVVNGRLSGGQCLEMKVSNKNDTQQCVIRNGGESSKYQGSWLASTPSRFDSEKLRSPPLRIHSTLVCHEVALIQWVRIPPGQLTVHPEAKRTDNPVRGKLKLRSFK